MATVYLKYTTWNSGTNVWNAFSSAKSFNCLEFYSNKQKDIISGKTIRQSMFVHQLGKRKFWNIVIGADVLYSTTNWNWLVTFFEAHRWQLSEDNITFYEVIMEDDVMPLAFSAGNKYLKKSSFKLTQKDRE